MVLSSSWSPISVWLVSVAIIVAEDTSDANIVAVDIVESGSGDMRGIIVVSVGDNALMSNSSFGLVTFLDIAGDCD